MRLIFHVIKIGRSTRAGKATAIENGLRPNLTEVLLGQKKRKHCHMIHHQNTLVMFQVSLLTTGIHHLNAHHFEYFLGLRWQQFICQHHMRQAANKKSDSCQLSNI
jgi:hypothetical protein